MANSIHELHHGMTAKFEARIRRGANPSDCWIWTGSFDRGGYGKIWSGASSFSSSHRFSYMLHVGDIPAGMEIDHLCRNRACCNPTHLEPVTRIENIARSSRGRNQTNCKRGHPLSGANLRVRDGKRECMTCVRARAAKYRQQRRQAAA